MSSKFFVVLVALAASPLSFAAGKGHEIPLDPAQFSQTRAQLEETMRKTDDYSELSMSQRRQLGEILDRMEQTLEGQGSANALDAATREQLVGDQQKANAMLAKAAEDSRQICKREKRIGSHRYTTTCVTVGERRRQQEAVERNAVGAQGNGASLSQPGN